MSRGRATKTELRRRAPNWFVATSHGLPRPGPRRRRPSPFPLSPGAEHEVRPTEPRALSNDEVVPATTPAVTLQPGPTVVSVASTKGRHGIKSLVITFDQAVDPSAALSVAHYQVSVPGRAPIARHGHPTATRPARPLDISNVAYNSAKNQVTVTLRARLHQREAIELQIKGTAGGLAGTQGSALNSPDMLKAGNDYIAALEVLARHS